MVRSDATGRNEDVPDRANADADLAPVRLTYVKPAPLVVVRGVATGRSYTFLGDRDGTDVDPRDAMALLATGLFRRAGT